MAARRAHTSFRNSCCKLCGFFFSAVIYIVFASSASASTIGIQGGQPISDSGTILLTGSVIDRIVASGATIIRVNFRLGPYSQDTSQFYSTYDTIVNSLRSKGLQVVGLMSNESWKGSQTDWTANNWEHTGKDGNNTYIDQFCYAFVRMAKHWEGKIQYWEIWNEPNAYSTSSSPGVYQGSTYLYPSNFAAMLTQCHSQVHYYNHINVQIISGGLFGHTINGYNTSSSGADYLDSTYYTGTQYTGKFSWAKAAYGSYPLDAIGEHLYVDQNGSLNTSGLNSYIDAVHAVITKWEGANTTKKTWITEFGWTTKAVSEAVQSGNLSSAWNILKKKSYIAQSLWFQLDDNPPSQLYFGIYRTDGSKKPSWTTFSNANAQSSPVGTTANGAVVSAILNYYTTYGGALANGMPYDNGGGIFAHYWDFGSVQDFKGGSIGRCAIFDTGHRVQAGFWTTYLSGTNHAMLKFPIDDEYGYKIGTRQDFQGGYMTWDPINNVRVYLTASH